jgi:hypothetical protein
LITNGTVFNSSSSSAASFLSSTTFIASVTAGGTVGVTGAATATYYAVQAAKFIIPALPSAPAALAGTF